jgi:hypothetical protein
VLADLGVAHAPAWLFHDELASRRVRRLLPAYERAPIAISALHAGHRRTPAKVRAVVDFFANAFADDPALTPRRTAVTDVHHIDGHGSSSARRLVDHDDERRNLGAAPADGR